MNRNILLVAGLLLAFHSYATPPPKYSSVKILTDTMGIVIDGFNALDQVVVMRTTTDGDLDWKPTVFDWKGGGMVGDIGTPIGAMPGAARLDASALNNIGQVVGAAINPPADPTKDPNDSSRAYVYTGGAFKDLSVLIAGSGAAHSRSNRINDQGDVVGVWMDAIGGPNHAFLYSGGILTEIQPPVASSQVYAHDINEAGQVAGSYVDSPTSGKRQLFLFDHGVSSKIDVGFSNTPVRINDHGQIAGYADTGDRDSRCYLYSDSRVTLIGPSPSSTSMVNCHAVGLSNDGVLAGVQSGPNSSDTFPFVYGDGLLVDVNSKLNPDDRLVKDQTKIISIEAANLKGDLVVRVAGGVYYLLTPLVDAPPPAPTPAPTPGPTPTPDPTPPPPATPVPDTPQPPTAAASAGMPSAPSSDSVPAATKTMSGGGAVNALLLWLLAATLVTRRSVRSAGKSRA